MTNEGKRSEAINLIDDIVNDFNKNNIRDIPQKSNSLTKHFFSHSDILHSELNDYFESSGLLAVLINSLEKIQETFKRDVLRLIYLILHVNRSLRDLARQTPDFQSFLLRNLDRSDCWNNIMKYKHHINIASQLLVDKEATYCSFNTVSVRTLARKAIDDIISKNKEDNPDVLPCIIYYACSMFTQTFEGIPKVPEDIFVAEKILSKTIIAKRLDVVRDYIFEFKIFYEKETETGRTNFVFYKPKYEYSFQQFGNTIIYYAAQSQTIQMDLLQAGLYGMINNFLSIKYMSELLLLCAIDILKLPILNDLVLKGFKNEHWKLINEKLKLISKRETLPEKTKMAIQSILRMYEGSPNNSFPILPAETVSTHSSTDNLIQLTNVGASQHTPNSFGFEKWGKLDVQIWLSDNHLESLQNKLPNLSGSGLKQLQTLARGSDKMRTVDFLMEKLNSSFDLILELIDALEKL